jgi:hypothetical protein
MTSSAQGAASKAARRIASSMGSFSVNIGIA